MGRDRHIVDIAQPHGKVLHPLWLARAESVHRQLRERLPADYVRRMTEIFQAGAGMSAAVADEAVRGLAVWRIIENTYDGRRFYIDDLVTDVTHRSQGVGQQLLAYLAGKSKTLGCDVLALDSGAQRTLAHRFYFRHGLTIKSFSFSAP